MNPTELMTILTDNEDSFLQAIITAVRSVKYGKSEFEYFESLSEMYATLKFLYDLAEDMNNQEWKQMKYFYQRLNSNTNICEVSFDDLEKFIFDEIKILINLAANVQKAKESVNLNIIRTKSIEEEI